jgi:signal peptidase I
VTDYPARPDPYDPFDSKTEEEEEASGSALSFLWELPILIFVALVVAVVIKTFLFQAFYIPSGSMIPTLELQDRVLVNKLSYVLGAEPERGDVVVFDNPFITEEPEESLGEKVTRNIAEALGMQTGAAEDLIKRVIGVGGDTIEIVDNTVLVNGIAIDEPYLSSTSSMPDFGPQVVPNDHIFVMGDNRSRSQDSRRFGAIPVEDVIGRAFVRVWPFDRWGGL